MVTHPETAVIRARLTVEFSTHPLALSPKTRCWVTDMLTAVENDTDVLAEVKEGFTPFECACVLPSPAPRFRAERAIESLEKGGAMHLLLQIPL
ncbi:hypothetical protein QVD17_20980 [Tagetes erecta]|uniref:Uncharacterized protein n=1 Tax=Tagetes erecta TaxID=13708 RepID=A0AAD8NYQ0_TARER|nr:hypothetical protein QVD17_20980 [Tagetes erecta]